MPEAVGRRMILREHTATPACTRKKGQKIAPKAPKTPYICCISREINTTRGPTPHSPTLPLEGGVEGTTGSDQGAVIHPSKGCWQMPDGEVLVRHG